MQIGMIGLGRMGVSLTRHLLGDGHQPAVYDVDSEGVSKLVADGVEGATSSDNLTSKLVAPQAGLGDAHQVQWPRRELE